MNQKAFESLRRAGMTEEQAIMVAPHTDMTDVRVALAQLEATWIKCLAVWVAGPVLLLLVGLIVSISLRA